MTESTSLQQEETLFVHWYWFVSLADTKFAVQLAEIEILVKKAQRGDRLLFHCKQTKEDFQNIADVSFSCWSCCYS